MACGGRLRRHVDPMRLAVWEAPARLLIASWRLAVVSLELLHQLLSADEQLAPPT
jgi:hypothetical protein